MFDDLLQIAQSLAGKLQRKALSSKRLFVLTPLRSLTLLIMLHMKANDLSLTSHKRSVHKGEGLLPPGSTHIHG